MSDVNTVQSTKSSPAPAGRHTITPRIFADGAAELVDFLRDVFGATGEFHVDRPTEMRIGDSLLMVSGTEFRPAMSACLYVYVDDVEATYRRAMERGSTSLEEPADMPYGDRRAMVQDPWGDIWQIAAPR